MSMSENLPATVPSLARAFEPERVRLQELLVGDTLSSAQIVTEARKALDASGARFVKDISDPHLHKAGLWLLEMVKAGAGILDRGTGAEVIWRETPRPEARKIAGRSLFYGAAGVFAVAGVLNGTALLVVCAGVLAGLRFFDPKDWAHLKYKIPFIKRPIALEDHTGRFEAEARITADVNGFIDSLADALRTADHIMLRLAEPATETHWRQDARLMGLVQGLIEAGRAEDGDFALRLIRQELESVLSAEGVQLIEYSPKTESLFDVLPGIDGDGEVKVVAPALMAGDAVIKRGTVWGTDE